MNYWLANNRLERISFSTEELFKHLYNGNVMEFPDNTLDLLQEVIEHQTTVFKYCEENERKRLSARDSNNNISFFAVGSSELKDAKLILDSCLDGDKAFLVTHIKPTKKQLVIHMVLFDRCILNTLVRNTLIDEFLDDNK